jgi:sarcosine oxidase
MNSTATKTLVVGGGVIGTAIAHELARSGRDVTLVERMHPGHGESASGDTTRILRSGYGSNAEYTARAWRSHTDWQELEEESGESLIHRTGVLWLATGDGKFEEETLRVLSEQNIPVRRVEPQEISELYPSINTQDVLFGVLETSAGVLKARRCVEVLAATAARQGVAIIQGTAVPTEHGVQIDGLHFEADEVIWAAGAWLPQMFPERISCTVTSQDAVFVEATDASWEVAKIPAWIDPSAQRYGIGAEGGRLKIASSQPGPAFNPWDARPDTTPEAISSALAYASKRFPGLAPATLAHVHPCQYASTADTQFILAAHPERAGWWFAGGDSGHAFKHALWIARHMRGLLEGKDPDPNFDLGPRDSSRGLRVSSN